MLKPTHLTRLLRVIFLPAAVSFLSACGGGGGGSEREPNPPVPVTPEPTQAPITPEPHAPSAFNITDVSAVPEQTGQIQLSWQASKYAAQYDVCLKQDTVNPCLVLATSAENQVNLAAYQAKAVTTPTYFIRASNATGHTNSNELSIDLGQLVQSSAKVIASNAELKDTFGQYVSLSKDGNTLAVGSPMEDGENESLNNSGAVYVYTRQPNGGWQQQAYLKANNAGNWDWFGASLSLSDDGNTLAIGAIGEASTSAAKPEENFADVAGAVYIFERSNNNWQQTQYLKASSNIEFNDSFGYRVELSGDGNTLAIGAIGDDAANAAEPADNSLEDSGAVYIFRRQADNGWQVAQYLKPNTLRRYANFGASIALSTNGQIMAVGAPHDSLPEHRNTGRVFIYHADTNNNLQLKSAFASAAPGPNQSFGLDLDLNSQGSTLVVGANGNQQWAESGAYIYEYKEANNWQHSQTLQIADLSILNNFGSSVSLSDDGQFLVVGDKSDNSGLIESPSDTSAEKSGAVYLFKRQGNAWDSGTFLKSKEILAATFFGKSLALSGDGSTLAVGADGTDKYNEDTASAIADTAGAVYVY
ncbi:FG-GAP repeat protein [Motilimonas cestriensis]|uniref:FG-GAP repeat protein n=1 Tax=Motilimonas cestriensis TaxID=2742685 RepID=A0ABS8W9X9_9GAMM|nr:FG-GAP repeat protein [Motilimonas cestriensis]MCE2595824.1 FG-GAP repeat protein [Motilimonas cestriensis]